MDDKGLSQASEGKKALITGASRGIGKAIAVALAAEGYDLFLTCRQNKALLLENAKELEQKFSISCHCYAFPIAKEDKVKELFAEIPYLDVLVNNAGISYIGLMTDMSYSAWKDVIDTNLNACFLTCRQAVPRMVQRQKSNKSK